MATDMKNALEALFNNESTSDLVVCLSEGVKFYVHKAVMMPTCVMIEQCVKWPQDVADNGSGSRAQCDIVLPDLTIPEAFKPDQPSPDDANRLFGLFLRTVYGLVQPSEYQSVQDVFSVLIIANYMMSNLVKGYCELDLVNRIVMDPSNVLDLILFCRKYNPFEDLFQAIVKYIATMPAQPAVYEFIFQMTIEEVLDLMEYMKDDPLTSFDLLLKYCCQISPKTPIAWGRTDDKIIITQQDRLKCLIEGYDILSRSWTTWAVLGLVSNRTSRIVVNLESGQDYTHLVMFRTLFYQMYRIPNNCYYCKRLV